MDDQSREIDKLWLDNPNHSRFHDNTLDQKEGSDSEEELMVPFPVVSPSVTDDPESELEDSSWYGSFLTCQETSVPGSNVSLVKYQMTTMTGKIGLLKQAEDRVHIIQATTQNRSESATCHMRPHFAGTRSRTHTREGPAFPTCTMVETKP